MISIRRRARRVRGLARSARVHRVPVVHATRHRSAGRWFRPASGDQRPARSRSDVASVGESLLASTAPAGASAAATRVARAP